MIVGDREARNLKRFPQPENARISFRNKRTGIFNYFNSKNMKPTCQSSIILKLIRFIYLGGNLITTAKTFIERAREYSIVDVKRLTPRCQVSTDNITYPVLGEYRSTHLVFFIVSELPHLRKC